VAKNRILERQRKARGFGGTMIGSLANLGQEDKPATLLKQLLGQ
jgi:hypothetical protein